MVNERATAEELVQETFIRVYNARDRYEPDARFSTWLYRIGRNLALNELDRSRNRAPHLRTDVEGNEKDTSPRLSLMVDQSSVDALVDARRESARMEAELAELPERQRSALWLAAVEGYSYDEIAEVLETSRASV
jgi:RNA polymerase sigma-70 factor, ECF subfamily